ncbi:hypothetical protein GQ43DRAFT_125842 [Delitschia confertaspora ATCC 74209]|uniref:Squalene/phytoene synthase n=1 Tax=Delitschia confertaspora ATCC 74209 TaxID=1513339 RepID=A0A9P4JLX7_9PLEO|nr:hypothetical protein GQ43DRAFT_125842 [Delitschia confertaspora ATCC 74209]
MRTSMLLRLGTLRQTSLSRLSHARNFHSTHPLADAESEVNAARTYCSNLIRDNDYSSYILQTFIPPSARDAYLAIRAFNVDVARIADNTSSPTIGVMRMQFWKDTVTKALAGSPPKEPVAILLAKAADDLHRRTGGHGKMSRSWFLRIINTREQNLGNPPYPNIAALESYAENTYSSLLYLTLSALPLASVTTDHFASHIGKAMGITAVLRGLPLVAFPSTQPLSQPSSHGAVLLPLDVMAETGVKEEDVFRLGSEAPGLRDAVFQVATRASDHLITAREMLASLRTQGNTGHDFEHQSDEEHHYSAQQLITGADAQRAEVERAFGVFMPSVATQSWLDRLQKKDFDIFAPELRTTDWQLPWRAYWSFYRRKL